MGAFMAQLDSNIVLISLPTIVRELNGMTAFQGIWVILGYSLAQAVLLLSFGRLSDIYGRVRLYKLGFALFTISSGMCSVAMNGNFLVASRVIQGTGSALIWANNAAIITDAFPSTERGKALGVNQVAGVSGSVLGLVLGGILTSTLGWRSVFWINLPFGTFATIWAHRRLRELGNVVRKESVDVLGNLLFGSGLTSLLIGLTLGAISGWSAKMYLLILAGSAMIILFLLAEKRVKYPMIDLSIFSVRQFTAGVVSNLLSAIARGTVSLILVFYFQGALLIDPFHAGILIIPFSIAFVLFGPLSGYLSDRYGSRMLASLGLAVSALASFIFASLPVDAPYAELVLAMVLAGAGGGMFVAPNMSSLMSSVPATRRGVASGTAATLFNTGFLLSLSVAFVIMASSMPIQVMRDIFAGLPSGDAAINLNDFAIAMHRVFLLTGLVSSVAVLPSLMRGRAANED